MDNESMDQVESITRLITTAINTRNFDATHPYHAKSLKTASDYITPSR